MDVERLVKMTTVSPDRMADHWAGRAERLTRLVRVIVLDAVVEPGRLKLP